MRVIAKERFIPGDRARSHTGGRPVFPGCISYLRLLRRARHGARSVCAEGVSSASPETYL